MIHGNVLLLSLISGIFATFNPCGFAMLPAYLSLAILDPTQNLRKRESTRKALRFSFAMGIGVVSVFTLFALVIFPFSTAVQRYLPFVTIAIGTVILFMGFSIISGRSVLVRKLWSPHVSPTGTLVTYIGYGVSFALGSISCTIGPFLAVTSAALSTSNFVEILSTYVVFGLGIAITVAILALITATTNQAAIRHIRNTTRKIEWISGVLLLVVGLYLVYFGWYELKLQSDATFQNALMDFVYRLQGSLVNIVSRLLKAVGLL